MGECTIMITVTETPLCLPSHLHRAQLCGSTPLLQIVFLGIRAVYVRVIVMLTVIASQGCTATKETLMSPFLDAAAGGSMPLTIAYLDKNE
mmetsp:Transcript_23063/g.39196  ORF Transcript_23063/g.39196 Transcript_23063/m.39196 type:complete len:91 (-) Transcript_23063:32-304(-)